jgi:acyl-CoA synthetase (AMP-forming)/AMP-acid ligase II
MNVATILAMAADGNPDRVAIGGRADGVTYGQLRAMSGAAAARIGDDADVVVFIGQSGIGFAAAFFASAWRGIPFVPLNYRLSDVQLRDLAGRHPRSLVITDARYSAAVACAASQAVTTTESWLAALPPGGDPNLTEPAESAQPALYLYTSGTSAAPKAAILHHRHLASYIFASVEFASAAEDEAALVSVPPYHIAGVANLLSNVFSGRRIMYLPSFDPAAWLRIVQAEAITQAMVVPTMLARIADAAGDRAAAETPTLRLISYGGARMHETVLRRVLSTFPGVGFVNAYGLTETSSSIAVLGPDDHRAALDSDDPKVSRRLGSVGKLLPGVEVQIRDERGTPREPGAAGDIWVRGEQVSGAYAGGSSATDAAGWFATRDAGWLDEEGYLFVEGRTDDTIIRGGENIAPAEVEDVLLRHPAVLDVAVVGLPDEVWGQRVAAVVTLRPGGAATAEDLRDWSRQHLRGSRAAEVVVFRDDLPRTDTGKVLRRVILQDLLTAG